MQYGLWYRKAQNETMSWIWEPKFSYGPCVRLARSREYFHWKQYGHWCWHCEDQPPGFHDPDLACYTARHQASTAHQEWYWVLHKYLDLLGICFLTEGKWHCHDLLDPKIAGSHSMLVSTIKWQSGHHWNQDPSKKEPVQDLHPEVHSQCHPTYFLTQRVLRGALTFCGITFLSYPKKTDCLSCESGLSSPETRVTKLINRRHRLIDTHGDAITATSELGSCFPQLEWQFQVDNRAQIQGLQLQMQQVNGITYFHYRIRVIISINRIKTLVPFKLLSYQDLINTKYLSKY